MEKFSNKYEIFAYWKFKNDKLTLIRAIPTQKNCFGTCQPTGDIIFIPKGHFITMGNNVLLPMRDIYPSDKFGKDFSDLIGWAIATFGYGFNVTNVEITA